MEQRLSYITLGVRDLPASRRFYERLGWTASKAGNEQIVFFQLGGIVLGLYGWDALAEDAKVPPAGSGFRGITLAYNTRSKQEADAVMKEAEAAGATVLKPAQDVFWGGYSGYFADPDGHAWEVCWNPGVEIRADGTAVLPG